MGGYTWARVRRRLRRRPPTPSLSRACFSASLASLWLRRSSRLCCCSLKPFCFCSASVIHRGPASFSWTLALSSECLLCREGFSGGRHVCERVSGDFAFAAVSILTVIVQTRLQFVVVILLFNYFTLFELLLLFSFSLLFYFFLFLLYIFPIYLIYTV